MQNNIIKRFDATYYYLIIAMLLTAFLQFAVITYLFLFTLCMLIISIFDKYYYDNICTISFLSQNIK